MGMIRVSEEVEKQLKELADGRSMSATVEMLIKGAGDTAEKMFGDGGGELVAAVAGVIKEHIDKRFDELKSLIEDTTVDRVAGPIKSAAPGTVKIYVPWDAARKLLYEFLPEDASEFIGSASEAIRQADDEFPVFIQDDKLWTEDFYGAKSPILNISPRVAQFLKEPNVTAH